MVAGDGKVPFLGGVKWDYKWLKRGDWDSFPALFFDNLSSILGIVGALLFVPLVPTFAGVYTIDYALAVQSIVFERFMPGLAIAFVVGNVWYAWMAFKLAKYEDRDDVTALPYGVNTPAGFVMAFQVVLPLCFQFSSMATPEEFAYAVWAASCSANFVGGLFEVVGALCGKFVRENLSKAALYAPIASVGFVFLGLSPFLAAFGTEPIIAAIPLFLAFTGFFANGGKGIYRFTALIIFAIGTILKWMGAGKYDPTYDAMGANVVSAFNQYAGKNSMAPPFVSLRGMEYVGQFIFIVFPVALQSFVETMENVEAAAAKGDHYNIHEAMVCDGVGTALGACFGTCLPTTVYIGHGRHKTIGAASAFSLFNALAYLILFMSGFFPVLYAIIDPISINTILIVVGLIIVKQSFEVSVSRHYPALCVGLFCVIANYVQLEVPLGQANIYIYNIESGGGIMLSLILTQILCDLTDLRFDRAAIFSAVATIFSTLGIMHGNNSVSLFAYQNTKGLNSGELTISYQDATYKTSANEGYRFAIAYMMITVVAAAHWFAQKKGYIIAPLMDNGDVECEEFHEEPDATVKKADPDMSA